MAKKLLHYGAKSDILLDLIDRGGEENLRALDSHMGTFLLPCFFQSLRDMTIASDMRPDVTKLQKEIRVRLLLP